MTCTEPLTDLSMWMNRLQSDHIAIRDRVDSLETVTHETNGRLKITEHKLDTLIKFTSSWQVKTDRKLEEHDQRFEAIDRKLAEHDKRFEAIDKRFDGIDKRFDGIDQRFAEFDQRFVELKDLLVDALKREN